MRRKRLNNVIKILRLEDCEERAQLSNLYGSDELPCCRGATRAVRSSLS